MPPIHTYPHRPNWRPLLLVLVCVGGLCIAALEKWRQDEVYRVWGMVGLSRVLYPVMNATNRGLMEVKRFGRMRVLETENESLRRELGEARLLEQLTAEELRREQRLSGLGHWAGPSDLRFITADVTGLVTNEDSAEMIINRGVADGVRVRDPVVALGGLVGLVQSVGAHTAHVQGLGDPLSAVGAVATKVRVRGVVYGRGRGKPLEFIPENEAVPLEVGMQLVTSGFENSVYPKGIVIGKITGRQANMYGMPFGAVQPMVPLESVEEVLLIVPRHRVGERNGISTATLGRYEIQMPMLPEATTATLTTSGTVGRVNGKTGTLERTATTSGTTRTAEVELPKPSPTPERPAKKPREENGDDADGQFGHHAGDAGEGN